MQQLGGRRDGLLALEHQYRAYAHKVRPHGNTYEWRKGVGVEPTRERLTPPTGFEVRPHHQERFPSVLNPL